MADSSAPSGADAQFAKRILVTGGAGFIGSHVVIHLVTRYPQYYIVNLDSLDYCSCVRNVHSAIFSCGSECELQARGDSTEEDEVGREEEVDDEVCERLRGSFCEPGDEFVSDEFLAILPKNYKFIHGSVTSADLVGYILKTERIDTIMHFAAQSHVDNSFGNSIEFSKTNILGTHVLLEAARLHGVKRFIHVSTDEVYGEGDPTRRR